MTGPIPPNILLGAYAQGIFPMADEGLISWFSPTLRGVIPLDERFHVPKGLRRALKRNPYRLRMDSAFEDVIRACAARDETWIDDTIVASYCGLFEIGHAHSVEAWDDEGLQGGLYGVSLGRAFFGESMFSRKTDASKIALVHLVDWLREQGFMLLDTQWMTDHLRQFGGYEVPRSEYLVMLAEALQAAESA